MRPDEEEDDDYDYYDEEDFRSEHGSASGSSPGHSKGVTSYPYSDVDIILWARWDSLGTR
jgi:hypothetical protein